MDLHCHQHQQYDNIWLSVAHLTPPSAFPVAPWELRHRQEFALRELQSTCAANEHSSTKRETNSNSFPSQASEPSLPQTQPAAFQLTPVREADLVGRCLYALQGIPIAVKELQLLAHLFCGQVADRSLHRLSSLWQRSSSTKALGRMLSVIAQAGWVRCQLEEFVQFFFNSQMQEAAISRLHAGFQMQTMSLDARQGKKSKKKSRHRNKVIASGPEELGLLPPYSLVNQAFAKAVKSILQGHLAALNTLTDAVLRRRSSDGLQPVNSLSSNEHVGAVIGLSSCDMTLSELYLHTNHLRVQLQVLGSICLHKGTDKSTGIGDWNEYGIWGPDEGLTDCEKLYGSGVSDFTSFPRGADLLTFLYKQLQDASDIHAELLRYLFSCACQPYLVFIHSWLYCAKIRDPYREFIVLEADSSVNNSVPVPCFLENVCIPLVRCGQQLQVLSRIVEIGAADASSNRISCIPNGFGMLESALNAWNEVANENSGFFPFIVFDKKELDELAELRRKKRHDLMQHFDALFSCLHSTIDHIECHGVSNVQDHEQDIGGAELSYADAETLRSTGQDMPEAWLNGSSFDQQPPKVEDEKMQDDLSFRTNVIIESSPQAPKYEEKEGFCYTFQQSEEESIESSRQASIMPAEVGVQTEEEECVISLKNCEKEGKQRKRWSEPHEVVIVHGQSDEQASLINQSPEGTVGFIENVDHMSDHEVDLGGSCNKLIECYRFYDSASKNMQSCSYFLPVLNQAILHSDSNLKSREWIPFLQSLPLAEGQLGGNFPFFFSNICLEEVGPEIFGRFYMHKLGQCYKGSGLPNSDGYIKYATNFDSVSHRFWYFEDCTRDKSTYIKFLPSIFTAASNADRTLNFDNKFIRPSHTGNYLQSGNTVGRLYMDSKKHLSFASRGCDSQGSAALQNTTVTPSVMYRAETPLDGFDGGKGQELLSEKQANNEEAPIGGAAWLSYLGLTVHEETLSSSVLKGVVEAAEIPLEIIIEKCLIQEVLSQYKCISHFTLRLIYEVFDLQSHLAALRRYFFMERGDWADNFTSALYHHAWHPKESLQRQLEVQTLLETAIQNSSCQEDQYAENLYAFIEKESGNPQSDAKDLSYTFINRTCLSAFDFISFGYRLRWPLSLIITSESLRLYNSTFNFLVRTKLAGHAVNDIWKYLKNLLHVSREGDKTQGSEWTDMLVHLRQQVNHFFTSLQGHIEMQLLHNVWCKFMEAIHHDGKDLLELKEIHELYLKDAIHVCFLSEEMDSVRNCINEIMQCVLDLSACLNIIGKEESGNPSLQSEKVQLEIGQALRQFQSIIRQLFQIAEKGHNHFSLSQFWTCLNFNGYFDSICLNHS